MFAPEFDYYRAGSAREAGELLRRHPGAKLLAGGHSLIPLLKLRLANPPALVDIGRIKELREIGVEKGVLRIGALTTHAELAASAEVREHAPALAEAAGMIGDPAVRNCGTIGGNVAHADPASDPPTVLLALDARFTILGPEGERTVDAADFFVGLMTTALGDGEVLTTVEVPVRPSGQGSAYLKIPHPASRYAVLGVAAALTMKDDRCAAASVAVGGLVPRPVRARAVEAAAAGQKLDETTAAAAAAKVTQDLGGDLLGDIHASAEYRQAMAIVYVRRALLAAAAQVR